MKGTEKQVAWEEDIINNAYKEIERHTLGEIEDISKAGNEIKRRFDNIVDKHDDAVFFIENRYKFSKDYITLKLMNGILRKMGSKYCF